ncbi:MAG: response regulator [Bryobacteraceae bacterium]
MKTIMVVDDEKTICRMVARSLEYHGYHVLHADSAQGGLECFKRHSRVIELVVTDILMPAMSGPEMVECILREKSSMKVLFMTGYNARDKLPDWQRNRFEVLGKPFTAQALANAVRRCLDDAV